MAIPRGFIYLALIAWTAVFVGLIAHLTGFRRVSAP
jgi:hypothetical protein